MFSHGDALSMENPLFPMSFAVLAPKNEIDNVLMR